MKTKSLQVESVDVDKIDAIQAGLRKKYGDFPTTKSNDSPYGPGTFGVEIEITPQDTESDADRLIAEDPSEVFRLLRGDLFDDFHEWIRDNQDRANSYRYNNNNTWDDAYGPQSLSSWEEDNPEPEKDDFSDESDYELALEHWYDDRKSVEREYDSFDFEDNDKCVEEFIRDQPVDRLKDMLVRYARIDGNLPEINEIVGYLIRLGEKASVENKYTEEGGDASEHEWGVGEDGDNIEVRTRHMEVADLPMLEKFISFVQRNYKTSANTSAHVHIGLPAEFDQFDLLAIATLVDETAVIKDISPSRKLALKQWGDFRTAISRNIIKVLKSKDLLHRRIHWNNNAAESLVFDTAKKYQGTNIRAMITHGTVEFRYFASEMEDVGKFIKWIRYFLLLPLIAKKRDKLKFVDSDTGYFTYVTRAKNGGFFTSPDPIARIDEPIPLSRKNASNPEGSYAEKLAKKARELRI